MTPRPSSPIARPSRAGSTAGRVRRLLPALALAAGAAFLAGPALAQVQALDGGFRGELRPHARVPDALPPLPPTTVYPVQLVLDDDSSEGAFGVAGPTNAQPFLWFNQFASPGDFELEEMWVLFPAASGVSPGDAIQLAVYQDPDGDPTDGADLLGTWDVTVQVVDGVTFSVYPLAPSLPISGPGDLYLGAISRFVDSGSTPATTLPAAVDVTTASGASWFAYWSGDPPEPPTLPPAGGAVVPFTAPFEGTFMIRGFGSEPAIAPVLVPTLGEWALLAFGALLAVGGAFLLGRRGLFLVALLVAGGLLAASPAAAFILVDDFTDGQGPVGPEGASSSTAAANLGTILGDERDLASLEAGGAVPPSVQVTGGSLTMDATSGSHRIEIVWDEMDGDPDSLDHDGLGGVDLTAGGAGSFELVVGSSTASLEATLEVYTDASNWARGSLLIPVTGATTSYFLDFAELEVVEGSPDLTDVGAIRLVLFLDNGTASLDEVHGAPPTVTVTKSASTLDDMPLGAVTPGTTFRYTVEVDTTDSAAGEGTDFTDVLDGSLTLVPDSVETTPIARPDQYSGLGNVGRTVTAGEGLLVNDSDPDDGGALTATVQVAQATAQGGTVDVAADGSFTYSPPAGFKGVDQFTYEVTDDEGQTAQGLATLTLEALVWFVDSDNEACGPGDCGTGTFDDPFETLDQAEMVSGPGDWIRLRDGADDLTDHDTGIVLKNGQRLIGEAVPLVIDGQTIEPAGTRPEITHSGGGVASHGIVLTGDHEIRGLEIDGADATAIVGNSFGTVIIEDVIITDADAADGGSALDLENGTVDATFGSIQSTSADGVALRLVGLEGSVVVNGAVTVVDSADRALEVSGAAAGFSLTTGALALDVAGGAPGANAAVVLSGNPASASFTFGQMTLNSDDGAGFVASGAGTVNLLSADNDVTAAGGPALDIGGTVVGQTGGAAGWTFDVVSSTGSPGDGVRLAGLASDFLVTTSTTVQDADGTGIVVTGSANRAIDFGATSVTDTNVGAGANGPAVDLRTGNGGASFTFDALDIVADGGFGLAANGAASLTVSGGNNDVTTTGGEALSVANVTTVSMSFDDVTVDNGAGPGVMLLNLGGSTDIQTLQATTTGGIGLAATSAGALGIDGGSVTSTNRAAVDIDNTALAVQLTAVTSNASNDHGVDLTNLPEASTFTVTGTTDINTTANEGVMLASIGGAGVLTFGPLQVDNAGAEGLEINTVAGGTTIGFGQTDITNRNATGIFVDDHDGAALSFGTVNIANPNGAGGYGMRAEDSATAVTLAAANISNTVQTVAETDPDTDFIPDNEGDGDGLFILRHAGSFTINGGTIQDLAAEGIDLRSAANLTLDGVTIRNNGMGSATNFGHGLRAIDLSGINEIRNTTFTEFDSNSGSIVTRDGLRVINTNTDTSLSIIDSVFSNADMGNDGILVEGRGTSQITLTLDDTAPLVKDGSDPANFTGLFGAGMQVNAGSGPGDTVVVNLTVRDIKFANAAADGINHLDLRGQESGTINLTVDDNEFDTVARPLFAAGVINMLVDDASTLQGTVSNNRVNDSSRAALFLNADEAGGSFDLTFENNTLSDITAEGIRVIASGGASGGDLIIRNNTLTNTGNGTNRTGGPALTTQEAIDIFAFGPAKTVNVLLTGNQITHTVSRETADLDSSDSATLNLTIVGNTFGNSAGDNGLEIGTFGSSTVCLDLNTDDDDPLTPHDPNTAGGGGYDIDRAGGVFHIDGMGAGPHGDAAVDAFIEARNTGPATVTGGGFTNNGGASCPQP